MGNTGADENPSEDLNGGGARLGGPVLRGGLPGERQLGRNLNGKQMEECCRQRAGATKPLGRRSQKKAGLLLEQGFVLKWKVDGQFKTEKRHP